MIEANVFLAQLDECAAEFKLPYLDNGYFYAVDARMHPSTLTRGAGPRSLTPSGTTRAWETVSMWWAPTGIA
ncbi:DUF7003 family protein [Streptomyces sp. NPDC059278]|uniref:DUF7003 family protein n=1 Tax=Streptomyces sp. NPDC059278 TaxID=3346801 RepID=UPI0036D0AC85